MTTLAAQKAGWFLDSEAPYSHTLPPPIKARLGHNGVESTVSEIVKVAAGPTWASVWVEHQGNVGYDSETPSTPYHNPWSEEMGIGDVEFCAAAATIIPHHHGVNWWPEAQFGVVGYAYCPYLESGAKGHGVWQYDYASTGQPASLHPGDLVLYSWGNNGVADHVETVVNVYADGSFDCIGYDTGTPNGCHFPIRRDRTFLLGVVHMTDAFYSSSPPVPPTLPVTPMFNPPLRPTFCATQVPGGGVLEIGDDGSTMYLLVALRADQQHTGMNTPDKMKDWGKRIAASVRIGGCTYKVEGVLDTHPPAYDNMPFTIKDTAGEFYDLGYKAGQVPTRW